MGGQLVPADAGQPRRALFITAPGHRHDLRLQRKRTSKHHKKGAAISSLGLDATWYSARSFIGQQQRQLCELRLAKTLLRGSAHASARQLQHVHALSWALWLLPPELIGSTVWTTSRAIWLGQETLHGVPCERRCVRFRPRTRSGRRRSKSQRVDAHWLRYLENG